MAGLEWDDLRYVLAVAEAGSLAGAARELRVNHSTVLRRIAAFEQQLGLRLFERLPTGYVPTAGGEELVAAARSIAETVTGLERKIAGQDLRLSGTLRITATDTLMGSVLPEILAEFRDSHPGIRVEIAVSNLMLNLTKREADIAIRPANDPPETLVGRRVAKIAFAIYGSPSYLARHGHARELTEHLWLAPDESLAGTAVGRWMRATLPAADIALVADSLLSLRQAAQAGLGLAALPCYLGDTSPGLVCVHEPIPQLETALWLLTHSDLRNTARIRAFIEFTGSAFAQRRPLLEGARARPHRQGRPSGE
jgi:DNA-binding transcriptional LysR family regulator